MDTADDKSNSRIYTCPMHPEVRRNGPGRCPACGMNLELVKTSASTLSRYAIAACLFLGIAAYFLWTEHRAHLMGALPYVLVLACPLIHLFMHRGHHGRAGRSHAGERS